MGVVVVVVAVVVVVVAVVVLVLVVVLEGVCRCWRPQRKANSTRQERCLHTQACAHRSPPEHVFDVVVVVVVLVIVVVDVVVVVVVVVVVDVATPLSADTCAWLA